MYSQIYVQCRSLVGRKFHISSAVSTEKPSTLIDSIIRVDHAGELGADRIYAGQMAVLGNTKLGPLIQHMWDQEKVHKAAFEELIVKHRVRPTAFVPIWNVAGFLLGAGTALMGEKAAMACTVAVESVIVDHYNDQLRALMAEPEKNKELMQTIQKFRDDEQEHHDTGIDHGAEQAPFYRALSEVIKFGCKTAIAISKGPFSQRTANKYITCRSYSTTSTGVSQSKWDLYSAVCLERKPVVLKQFNGLEKKLTELLGKLEMEGSHKSNHEISAEEELKRAEEIKKNPKSLDFDVILEQTSDEFETASGKELEAFLPSSLITTADLKSDIKSLNRKLDYHLLFLVKEKFSNGYCSWALPGGVRKETETMREAAERSLHEKCGDNLNVLFLGNAPCGFYKYRYPKNLKTDSFGAKVFFFKAIYVSGSVALKNENYCDYQWATRVDLKKLLDKAYFKKVKRFLIDDDDDDDDEDDYRINELRKKENA